MRVKYSAIGQIRQSRKGFIRDAIIELNEEKVYVVLFSEDPALLLQDEGVVDIDLSRLLRGKLLFVRSHVHNVIDELVNKTKKIP